MGDLRRLPMGEEEAGFTPASLSGLVLWLDAADPSTLYQNSGLTVRATADNDPVGGWVDKSGRGTHAVQSTSGWRPLLRLNQQNGKPMIVNDGVDDSFSLVSPLTLTDFSVIAVVRTGNDVKALLGNSSSNFQVRANYTGLNKLSLYANGTPSAVSNTLPVAISTGSVLEWSRSGSTASFFQNGGSVGTVPVGVAPVALDTCLLFSGTPDPTVYIGEVLVVGRMLNSFERASLYNWLSRKWSV